MLLARVSVGHMQRLTRAVAFRSFWNDKALSWESSDLEIGKLLSNGGIADFNQTHAMNWFGFRGHGRIS